MVLKSLIRPSALVALLTASTIAYRLEDTESNLERSLLGPGISFPGQLGGSDVGEIVPIEELEGKGIESVDGRVEGKIAHVDTANDDKETPHVSDFFGNDESDADVEPLQRRPVRPDDNTDQGQSVTVNPRPSRLPPNTIVIKPSLISFERCEIFRQYLEAGTDEIPTIGFLRCEQACFTQYLCPDDCLKREQLVDYCNNVYLDLSNLLSISKVCDVCTYQCRDYCLTYTKFCCPCKGGEKYNRYALEIEPDDYSCKEFFVRENVDFNDEEAILKRGTKEWSGPDVYGAFISDTKGAAYWYAGKFKHASPGLGIGYGNGPATGEASALFLWKQKDFGNDLDVGPVRWFHTPGSSDSEDRVRYKGDNYYCSDVCDHSIDSKFRVVFQDSGGWHIAKTTKDTAKGLRSIYMADPDREYRRFDPYKNDYSQIEAGTTYKDSCPTFTCIQWIGFRIDTDRKCSHKYYSGKKDDCALSVVEEFNVKAKGSTLRTEDIPRLSLVDRIEIG